ncbi:MAG: MBL fold metallo-hydrolase [Solirubrobacteraceae bacterium]
MCDYIREAVELAAEQRLSRRGFMTGSAAIAGAGLAGASSIASASARPVDRAHAAPPSSARGFRTRVVLLGTAGGPVWWHETRREGISSAVVVNGSVYLVDCGEGVGRQYRRAGLGGTGVNDGLERLRGIFLTHLHSDHIIDYPNVWLFGLFQGLPNALEPVQVYGPGNRGKLPPVFGPAPPPPVVNPGNPTPGTVEMTESLLQAYAADINDRMRDNRARDPRTLIEPHDIALPPGVVSDPNVDPAPPMAPFSVVEDDNVRVTATLVQHAPVFPAFAFRFDSDDGAVVFSGDTAPSENLVSLARGADVLVHEVIDRRWVMSLFPDPSEPRAKALIRHLLDAHTTIEDVGAVAERAEVKTLVLSHLAPANNPDARWRKAGKNFSGRLVVGRDLHEIGVGRRRGGQRRAPR